MTDLTTVAAVQALVDSAPLHRLLKMTVEEVNAKDGRVVLSVPHRPELERLDDSGQFHGGVIATLIDSAGDMAVASVVGGAVPTISLRVDYLRPAGGGTLRATAVVRRAGRSIAVADIEVTDAAGRIIALGRGTYSAVSG